MKKIWNGMRAVLSLGIVLASALLPACFEPLQHVDGNALLLGLPFPFYTIRCPLPGTFAVHLNIAALAGNLLAVYFLLHWANQLAKRFHR